MQHLSLLKRATKINGMFLSDHWSNAVTSFFFKRELTQFFNWIKKKIYNHPETDYLEIFLWKTMYELFWSNWQELTFISSTAKIQTYYGISIHNNSLAMIFKTISNKVLLQSQSPAWGECPCIFHCWMTLRWDHQLSLSFYLTRQHIFGVKGSFVPQGSEQVPLWMPELEIGPVGTFKR